MNGKVGRSGKKAGGITVELLLAVILSVVVLFLILSLFSNNLKQMVVNSNISRMFANNSAKTANANWEANPTQTQVNVKQVNVQIVADQGLDWYRKNAIDLITKYKNQKEPLSDAQIADLAEQITIAKICGVLDPNDENHFNLSPYNIYANLVSGKTSINNKAFYYQSANVDLANQKEQLSLIKNVMRVSFK